MENMHFFPAIAEYLRTIIVNGGYAILFITTFLEGLPLIGMAIPGHVAIILAGFLAKIGTLNLFWVMSISTLGAVLGDFMGFYLGRKYGLSLIDRLRPYFFIRNEHIEKTQSLLARHTGKAMILGRFNPVTRALMPFLVGTNQTTTGKFWFFNIIGGLSWVIISVGVGYVFGASYHVAVGVLGKFVVVALIVIALIIWGYRFVNLRFHAFAKYEIFTLIINVAALLVLARMIQDAVSPHSFFTGFDVWVSLFVAQHAPLFWVHVADWVSKIFSSEGLMVIGGLLSLWLLWTKKWRRAALTILSIGSTAVALSLLKDYFVRARPENAYELITSYSFPSGHASLAAAFFVVVAYLVVPRINSWIKRELVVVACVFLIALVGISRIILNVHWASDVIAGWALGTFLATASILFVRYASAIVKKKR
ncbi:MAG: bifunctional DedA family/phosphatase PAP2 family protein [Patescibacteria group bacterium]